MSPRGSPHSSNPLFVVRMMRHEAVRAEAKSKLSERRTTLDPVALLHTIREAQSALTAIVSPEVRPTPRGEKPGMVSDQAARPVA